MRVRSPLGVEGDIKRRVKEFYDSVGWQLIGEDLYQNARYEDLRPVSREYIQRCHRRVGRHLPGEGRFFLDAGSGPIQYPVYLEYSKGYEHRVCLDISEQALREARDRIGDHGLFVVGDIANLPFKGEVFKGVVSLHTIHHLPEGEHHRAFFELQRVMRLESQAVVVYSWGNRSWLMRVFETPIQITSRLIRAYGRKRGGKSPPFGIEELRPEAKGLLRTPGTYTFKHDYRWVIAELSVLPDLEVRVWRSISTSFTRAFIHRRFLGQWLLRFIYWFEERAPRFFGRIGQYPMILFKKNAKSLPIRGVE